MTTLQLVFGTYGNTQNTNADSHIILLTICLTSLFHDLCGVSVVLLCEGLKWPVITVVFSQAQQLVFEKQTACPADDF